MFKLMLLRPMLVKIEAHIPMLWQKKLENWLLNIFIEVIEI